MATIRDLRDLVNVSRLSYIESDDDNDDFRLDDEDNTILNLTKNFKLKPKISSKKTPDFKFNSTNSLRPTKKMPILSKTVPIEGSKKKSTTTTQPLNKSRDILLLDRNSLPTVFPKKKLPLPPLGGVKSALKSSDFEMNEEVTEKVSDITKSIEPLKINTDSNLNGNFDQMLLFIDASVVSDWLNRANRSLRKMHKWHQNEHFMYSNLVPEFGAGQQFLRYESFILFVNFWLGGNLSCKLEDKQRRGLIEMEHSILSDEVRQAFEVGVESQDVKLSDVNRLLRAVFKEYPLQLLSFRGTYLIVDYIDVLSSNRHEEYRKLLADVKCRTRNKQHAKWLLSIRSFALVSLCWSIVKFYRKSTETKIKMQRAQSSKQASKVATGLEDLDGRLSVLTSLEASEMKSLSSSESSCSSNSSTSGGKKQRPKTANFVSEQFLNISDQDKYNFYLEAVLKNDFPDVLHYLIVTRKCDPYRLDEKGRSLIFLAVMNEKPKILNYLVKRWPSIDVNRACDSGNTPLHAAVNKGKLDLVETLLQSLNEKKSPEEREEIETSLDSSVMLERRERKHFALDIDRVNEKCMSATPLHLAVWNEYNEIALKLLHAGASPYLKMNGESNAFDLAMQSNNQTLHELLKEFSNAQLNQK